MVATKKNNTGDIRLCVDHNDLNRASLRPHNLMRTVVGGGYNELS